MKVNYKLSLVPTTILILLAVWVLMSSFAQTGEWFQRSIELRGGTLVTVTTDTSVSVGEVKDMLSESLGEVSVKETRGITGNGLIIQADSGVDPDQIIDSLKSVGVNVIEYSAQTIGPALGESFWSQAQLAIVFAFVMMGIIVFLIFRTPVPSGAVILCAVSDIIITLGALQVFGIELSLAGLAALLMLIGYSVDSDIMLTTRILRGTEDFMDRMKKAFKTGLTMSATTIAALVALLVAGVSPVLSQIAIVLLIGLLTDLCLTWLQNATLLRWHMERKGVA
ncbi:MAG: protein translocase subunit SecF [Candidatus Aenigmatarchaeota archaeon]|nr:MAG: protein translocase subunit SecF [Candidatus Aenigmarchaeota archaeon]